MTEPQRDLSIDQQAAAAALSLGKAITGRELTSDEAEAMTAIFRAAAEALRHGFIKRLASQVKAERETENVEEFFEDIIKPN